MPSFLTILSATVPVFLVVGIGFFWHRKGWLGEEIEVGVMRLAMNFFIPCLILTMIPGNPALQTASSAIWAIVLGFLIIVIGFAVTFLVSRISGMKKGQGLRTFIISCGIQNYGYLPIPILLELFPDDTGPSGLVFVHGIGVELAMWTVGLAILSGKAGWRSAINGPFLAVITALILNYTGGYQYIPGIIQTVIEMMGKCAIPLSIFMIGATMGRFFEKEVLNDAARTALVSIFVRLVLLAGLILAAAKYLPLSEDLQKLLVVQAAMPAAIFPILITRLYGGRPQVAIQVVLATSVVSMVTAPFVIAYGMQWVGQGKFLLP